MTQARRLFLNVLATYARSLLALVCGLFTGRWVLEALGTQSFGVFGVIGVILSLVAVVNQMLASSVSRYFAFEVGKSQSNGNSAEAIRESMAWFNTAFSIHFTLSVLLISIGYPLGHWAVWHYFEIPPELCQPASIVLAFSMVTTFVSMVSVPFTALYTAHQYIAELTIYSCLQTVANVVFAWILLRYDGDRLVFNAFYMMLISVVPQVVIAARAFWVFPECRVRISMMANKARYRSLFSFAGWQMIGWFGMIFRYQGLVTLCNKLLGLVYNSTMSIADTVSSKAAMFSSSLDGSFLPAITNAAGAQNVRLFESLTLRASKLSTLMCLVFVLPLCLEMHYVIRLWLTVIPPMVDELCLLSLIAYVIGCTTNGYASALFAKGQVAWKESLGFVIWVATFLFAWLFVAAFDMGIVGIGLAIVIGMLLNTVKYLVLAVCQLKVSILPWFRNFIFPLAFVGALSVAGGLLVRELMDATLLRCLLVVMTTSILFGILSIGFVCDKVERTFLREKAMAVLRKLS